jgi:hypothetical protein
MKNIINKCIDYDIFTENKDIYPYLEDSDIDTINCKRKIKKWLRIFLEEIQKIGFNNIYSLNNNYITDINNIIENESFLFYSYEEGMEEEQYLITKKSHGKSLDYNTALESNKDSFLLVNDHDGIGLGFMMIDKKINEEISNIKSQSFISLHPTWEELERC